MSAGDVHCPCGCGAVGWPQHRDRMVFLPDEEIRVTSSTGGQKGTKLARYDLIPAEALRIVAETYGRGAGKYDDHNWRRGYDWSLSFASLMRHAWKFWEGEDLDPETGAPHMACAVFHGLSLITFMIEHPEFDNRPGRPA